MERWEEKDKIVQNEDCYAVMHICSKSDASTPILLLLLLLHHRRLNSDPQLAGPDACSVPVLQEEKGSRGGGVCFDNGE